MAHSDILNADPYGISDAPPVDKGPSRLKPALAKIGLMTLLGVAVPFMLTGSGPQTYSAETRLKLQSVSEQSIVDAATRLRDKANLDNLVRALNLGRDSGFAGTGPSMMTVVSDIVSGQQMTMSEAEAGIRDRLSKAIAMHFDRTSSQLQISVTSGDAEEAAGIANMLGSMFREEITAASAAAPDPLLEGLRKALERSQASLAGFVGSIDADELSTLRQAEAAQKTLLSEIATAETQVADLTEKSAQASALTLAGVLGGELPDSLEFTGLDYQRQRYVEAKLGFDQMAIDLGPLHPRMQAAKSAVDGVRADIQQSLKQLVTSLSQQQATTAATLVELKQRQGASVLDPEQAEAAGRLGTLQAAVQEAGQNYREALQRTETAPKITPAIAQVLRAATPQMARVNMPDTAGFSGTGALVGLALGLALAIFTRRRSIEDQRVATQLETEEVPMDELDVAEALEFEVTGALGLESGSDSGPDPGLKSEQQTGLGLGMSEPLEIGERVETVAAAEAWQAEFDDLSGDAALEDAGEIHQLEAANDMSLADHIREILLANSMSAEQASVPSLMAAVLEERLAEEPRYETSAPMLRRGPAVPSVEEDHGAEEMNRLHQEMVELRDRLQSYKGRRVAGRG